MPGFLLSVVLTLGVLTLSIGMFRGKTSIADYLRLRASQEILARSNADLERQNASIRAEVVRIQQSQSYAEKTLRDKYHVVRAGERIVFFAE